MILLVTNALNLEYCRKQYYGCLRGYYMLFSSTKKGVKFFEGEKI